MAWARSHLISWGDSSRTERLTREREQQDIIDYQKTYYNGNNELKRDWLARISNTILP